MRDKTEEEKNELCVELLRIAPHFEECSGPEPALSYIIWRYYQACMPDKPKVASSYAQRYILALVDAVHAATDKQNEKMRAAYNAMREELSNQYADSADQIDVLDRYPEWPAVAAPQPASGQRVLPDEPLWNHKGNVRHDAVDRLGERQRQARQPVSASDAASSCAVRVCTITDSQCCYKGCGPHCVLDAGRGVDSGVKSAPQPADVLWPEPNDTATAAFDAPQPASVQQAAVYRNALEHIAGSCEGPAVEIAKVALSKAPSERAREAIESRQREMLRARFAARPSTQATADFDLPAPNDPVGEQQAAHGLSDAQIREIFLMHGFRIQPGCDDLKPYVYAAASALLSAAAAKGDGHDA